MICKYLTGVMQVYKYFKGLPYTLNLLVLIRNIGKYDVEHVRATITTSQFLDKRLFPLHWKKYIFLLCKIIDAIKAHIFLTL